MRATLEFNLPNDQEEFEHAINGLKWKLFALHVEQYLREQYKYNEDVYTEDQRLMIEQIRNKFYEILKDDELILD